MDSKYPSMADNKHQSAALERLARKLNVPIEAFLNDWPEGEAGDLLALMRLWAAIKDSQGRRRVISVARLEAERADYAGQRLAG
jgi:hypothetical protein